MGILSDTFLVSRIRQPAPLVQWLDEPIDLFDAKSAVQPASIDLHVGAIFIPGKRPSELGGIDNAKSRHTLGTGETVVIRTKETLHVPSDVAAFGFPPTQISSAGVLMTNPGHIGPGFQGTLTFTLINMGREAFPVTESLAIVTVLFAEVAGHIKKDYAQRKRDNEQAASTTSRPNQSLESNLTALSNDFLDVGRRARKIAREEMFKAPIMTAVLGLIGAGMVAAIGYFTTIQPRIARLESQITQLREQVRVNVLPEEVDSLRALHGLPPILTPPQ